jgi:hypothetical protein
MVMTTTTKLGNKIELLLAERLLKVFYFSLKDEQYVNGH